MESRTSLGTLVMLMIVGIVSSQTCSPDRFEPNNNVSTAGILSLAKDQPIVLLLTFCNRTIDKYDYFNITIPGNGSIDVIVNYSRTVIGDIDVELIDASSSKKILDGDTGSQRGYEGAQATIEKNGTYMLEVLQYEDLDSPKREYTLTITWFPGILCTWASNINSESALPLTAGVLLSPSWCTDYNNRWNLTHWYHFTLTQPSIVSINANWSSPLNTDLWMDVYEESDLDTKIGQSSSTDQSSRESYLQELPAGSYYVQLGRDDSWALPLYLLRRYDLLLRVISPETQRATSSSTWISSSSSSSTSETSASALQDPAQLEGSSQTSNNTPIIAGAAGGGGFLIILVVIIIVLAIFRKRKSSTRKQVENVELELDRYSTISIQPQYSALPSPQATIEVAHSSVRRSEKSTTLEYGELENLREIGNGSFGVVYRAKWRQTEVAVKQLHSHLRPDARAMDEFTREAELLHRLRPHPNLVLFIGMTVNPMAIVTEYCSSGSLYSFIHSDEKISAALVKKWILGIAKGMLHLHCEGIIHRDLAARNVLLSEDMEAKVSDFGLSRYDGGSSNQTVSQVGPLKWMAPESLRSKQYSTQSDMWSFGVVMWEILTRQDPFPDLEIVEAAMKVTYEKLRLEIPKNIPTIYQKIMTDTWKEEPSQRPDFNAICNSLQSVK